MDTNKIAEALRDHGERMLTYNTRRLRVLSAWLNEIDKLYNLLILYRVELLELGVLEDLQVCASKMLTVATEETEVMESIAASSEQEVKELLGAI